MMPGSRIVIPAIILTNFDPIESLIVPIPIPVKINYPVVSCGAFTAEQSSWGLPPPNLCLPFHPACKLSVILGKPLKWADIK